MLKKFIINKKNRIFDICVKFWIKKLRSIRYNLAVDWYFKIKYKIKISKLKNMYQ